MVHAWFSLQVEHRYCSEDCHAAAHARMAEERNAYGYEHDPYVALLHATARHGRARSDLSRAWLVSPSYAHFYDVFPGRKYFTVHAARHTFDTTVEAWAAGYADEELAERKAKEDAEKNALLTKMAIRVQRNWRGRAGRIQGRKLMAVMRARLQLRFERQREEEFRRKKEELLSVFGKEGMKKQAAKLGGRLLGFASKVCARTRVPT